MLLSQKQLKNTLLKDLPPPPIGLKQFSVIFILINDINNLIDHAKIYMTLLVSKNIQNNYFIY